MSEFICVGYASYISSLPHLVQLANIMSVEVGTMHVNITVKLNITLKEHIQ